MHVHGNNIAQKISSGKKYADEVSQQYLSEIKGRYDRWVSDNRRINGPFATPSDNDSQLIEQRVQLFNEYKDFIDQQHFAEKFDSRSNLHSSVLEEFLLYLFSDLISSFSGDALIGKSHAFKDLFFRPSNFRDLISNAPVVIEKKDHDFVIGAQIETTFLSADRSTRVTELLELPVVAIECKTYLDKTMLEGSSTAGNQLRVRNPNALYFVVAEWLKLTESVNLKKYDVDQIYVLRKQKNTDREFRYADDYVKNPIFADVVIHMFEQVRDHLTADWSASKISEALDRGFLK